MARYVLKRQSSAAVNSQRIGDLEGILVVDKHDDLLILVEAEPETMKRHRAEFSGWTIARETSYEMLGAMQPPKR